MARWLEFLYSIMDSTYVASDYRKPVFTDEEYKRLTREERKQRLDQAVKDTKEAGEAYVQIAKNTETALVATGQVAAGTAGFVVGGPMGAVIAAEAVEGLTNTGLKIQSEAPLRSPVKILSPIHTTPGSVADDAMEVLSYVGADLRGDKHYQSGSGPDDHPVAIEQRHKMEEITRKAFAKHGLAPDGSPLTSRNESSPEKPDPHGQTAVQDKSKYFGIGSGIGGAISAIAAFLLGVTNPLIAIAVVAVGALVGQPVLNLLGNMKSSSTGSSLDNIGAAPSMPSNPTNAISERNPNADLPNLNGPVKER